MRINHNIAALNTYRQFNNASNAQSKSMEKLSSGLRINSAADDAAGLAISEKMRGQIRGLDMASKNAQDGVSLIQTAEGALNETHDILQRMRELAVQSSTDTNTFSDRKEIQKEMNQLKEEVDRIGKNTEFNTQTLLSGGFSNKQIQIGANSGQTLTISFKNMTSSALGTSAASGSGIASGKSVSSLFVSGVDSLTAAPSGSGAVGVLTQSGASSSITVINDAIEKVSAERSKMGAWQNRLDHTINNLNNSSENLTSAESRIRDVDMAKEMMEQTKNSILSQASQAMLSQANQQPQSVLQLLR